MGIIGTIIIGFIAGLLAKFLTPGDNEPSGFILTTLRLASRVRSLPPISVRPSAGIAPVKAQASSALSSAR